MADWAVEVLNDLAEAELLSLPKDMQARVLRMSELVEFRASTCWFTAPEILVKKTQKAPRSTLTLALKRLKELSS